jgi:hypothetical protein
MRVGDSVNAKIVGHIRNLVLQVRFLGKFLHWTLLAVVDIDSGGGLEAGLDEATFENLHDTVGVGVARQS